MSKLAERYATSINSSNLAVDPRTTYSDTDVLAAFGFADRALKRGMDAAGNPVHPAPMAVALQRLFSGDNKAALEIINILADMAFQHSWVVKVKLSRVSAYDMACACLAWHRDGTCKSCGGHGKTIISGTKTHSDRDCPSCFGMGKVPFERNFKEGHRDIARWLIVEMDRESGRAGVAAMRALAPNLDR